MFFFLSICIDFIPMNTPQTRQMRAKGVAAPASMSEEVTPSVAPAASRNKSSSRPSKAKPPVVLENASEDEEEEEMEGTFNGHTTMRSGQLSAAKRKHAETVPFEKSGSLSAKDFEKELKRRCDEIAEKINEDCIAEVHNIKKSHAQEINKLKVELDAAKKSKKSTGATVSRQFYADEILRVAATVAEEKNEELAALKEEYERKIDELTKQLQAGNDGQTEPWSMNEVIKYLISNKLRNLNDGHSSQATNKTINYIVSNEELALCLHCFVRGRDPESCIFKKGKFGSLLHRKPKSGSAVNAKCSKPGIPDRNDAKVYHCRHILGKDYLLFR